MNLFFALCFALLLYCCGVGRVLGVAHYVGDTLKAEYDKAVPPKPFPPPPRHPIRHREPRVIPAEDTPPARLRTL